MNIYYLIFFLILGFIFSKSFKCEENSYTYYNNLPESYKNTTKFESNLIFFTKNYSKCTMGLEMELEFQQHEPNFDLWNFFMNKQCYFHNDYKKTWKDIILIKSDPSLRNGIEFAFLPLTFSEINYIKWNHLYFFLNLIDGKITLHNSIQIHISKNCLIDKNILKIGTYIYKNKKKMIKFMKRESYFAKIPDYKYYSNSYNKNLFHKKFYNVHNNIYYNTIELRGFLMTLNYNQFKSYLHFAKSLILYNNNLFDEEYMDFLVEQTIETIETIENI